jgi:N-acetylneuraminic acid mutarotase
VRFDHTATLLPNGKVLVAAGRNSTARAIESAELYDPATGTWSGTGSLITARDTQTATLLQDGKVLVTGGILPQGGGTDSAELYDPTTGTWTSTGSMSSMRDTHTATLLPNGKVLVAGGEVYPPSGSHTASSHLYDPNTGTWSATGSLNTSRAYHTATLLPNGKVLVTGGVGNGSSQALSLAEVYDPNTGTWSRTDSLNTARVFHPAILLPNGKVLVAGGSPSTNPRGALASAELYDLTTGTWTATGSMAADRDDVQTAMVLLNTGQVLMTGGVTTNGTKLSSAELFLQR